MVELSRPTRHLVCQSLCDVVHSQRQAVRRRGLAAQDGLVGYHGRRPQGHRGLRCHGYTRPLAPTCSHWTVFLNRVALQAMATRTCGSKGMARLITSPSGRKRRGRCGCRRPTLSSSRQQRCEHCCSAGVLSTFRNVGLMALRAGWCSRRRGASAAAAAAARSCSVKN